MRTKQRTKTQKFLIILTVLALLMGDFKVITLLNSSYASTLPKPERSKLEYFGNQLTGDARKIYDAMFYMYQQGIFMEGESYEIGSTPETKPLSEASLVLFANGNQQLLTYFGAARDAFQNDYPECFYVDWDEISIRVTQSKDGRLHASIGAARSDSYLLSGMNKDRCSVINGGKGTGIQGAVLQYEEKINEVVNKIKSGKLDQEEIEDGEYSNKDEIVRMVGEAHDYVVKHMIYKHEYEVSPTERAIDGITGHNSEHRTEISTSRTVYDGLIYGEGVCESYTRTFKAILDRLGIPCVCVTGLYNPKSTINEPHIWNYVQIDGAWYGVDVTHDDPTMGRFTYTKDSGKETREFFLVGAAQLSGHHIPTKVMSAANYEFEYPVLAADSLRDSYKITTDDGFYIDVEKDTQEDDQTGEMFDSGTFYVSYNHKNFTENAKEGKYIIVRYFTYAPRTDKWEVTNWSYLDPWTASFGEPTLTEKIEPSTPVVVTDGEDKGEYKVVRLELPQIRRAQFAITDVPPAYLSLRTEYENKTWQDRVMVNGMPEPTKEFSDWSARLYDALMAGAAYYTGNVDNLKVKTDEIENKWGNYVAPPYPIKCTPYQGGSLYTEQTHHITIQFDQNLALTKEGAKPGIVVSASSGAGVGVTNAGATAVKYSNISNIKWDGGKIVEFDFTPSDMWADDCTYYNFQVTNLVGYDTGKVPLPVTYGVVFFKTCGRIKPDGVHRVVYAQPMLMDSSDMDMKDWTIEDIDDPSIAQETMGEFLEELGPNQAQNFLDSLKTRITLVTSEPSYVQDQEMKQALRESEYADDFANATKVNTYNLSISVCKKNVVKQGEGVRIILGSQKGTSYEDFAQGGNLAYKAYHYKVDPATDKLTGEVEEIDVTVTRQGLILIVDSFSPFTLIETNKPETTTEKKLVIGTTEGGKVLEGSTVLEGANGIVKLNEGNSKTITITPDEGYEIDYITLDDVRQKIDNKSGETLTIGYDSLNSATLLDVGFVAKEIHEEEEAKGLSSDFEVPNIAITFPDDKTEFESVVGDKVEIEPIVMVTGGDFEETKDENFDPSNATADNHPDYVQYEWYVNESKGTNEEFKKLEGQNKKTLTIENVSLENDKHSYYVVATPMKWSNGKYEPMKEKDTNQNFNQVSSSITLSVLPEIQLELTSDEDKKPVKGSDGVYTLDLNKGDTYNLIANMYRIYEEEPTNRPATRKVTWTVEETDKNIIKVSESGYLTATDYRTDKPATVTATVKDVNGKEKTATLKVSINKVDVEKVEITSENMKVENTSDKVVEMNVADNVTLHANVTPNNASLKKVIWSINPGSDLDISTDGVITIKDVSALNAKLVQSGKVEATVTATVDGKTDTCKIRVVKTGVTGLSDDCEPDSDGKRNVSIVDPTSAELAGKASEVKIDINVVPEYASNKKVKVSSNTNNNAVEATINEDGNLILKALKYDKDTPENNKAVVTVVSEDNANAKLVYNVTVTEEIVKIDKVEIVVEENGDTKLEVGEGVDLNAKVTAQGNEVPNVSKVEWKIKSGSEFVDVSDSGYVTAKKVGKATITAKVYCQEANCDGHESDPITIEVVKTPVKEVEINGEKVITSQGKKTITLQRNDDTTLEAVVSPDTATYKDVKWSASPEGIVELSKIDGAENAIKVTAKKAGTATITATADGVSAQVTVNVTPIAVEGVILDPLDLIIKDTDKKVKIGVSLYPEHADDADAKYVTWESSDTKVVKVDKNSGEITPVAPGNAVITARYKGSDTIYEECNVTVVSGKTNLTVYTVDQKANFIAGMKVLLTRKDENGLVSNVGDIVTSTGKVEFTGLEDGEYTIYVMDKPTEDIHGNPLNITNVVEFYTFKISDGKVLYTSSDSEGNTILKETGSLVLVSTTDGTDAKVEIGEDFDNIEDKYKDFYEEYKEAEKNKPENKPGVNGNGGSGTGTANPDDPVYNGNETDDNDNNEGNGDQEQETPTKPDDGNKEDEDSVAPKTGDIAIGLFAVIMNVSLIGIIVLICKKGKINAKTKH